MKKLLGAAFVTAAVSAALLVPGSAVSAGPIAGVGECPRGYAGFTIWHVDYNTGGPVDLVRVCVPLEP